MLASDQALIPEPSSSELDDLLSSTKLTAFAEPMASYGLETLSDLDQVGAPPRLSP